MDTIKSATIIKTTVICLLFDFPKKKLEICLNFYIIKLAQFMHWTIQKKNSLFESLFLYLTNGLQTLHPRHLLWCEMLSWNTHTYKNNNNTVISARNFHCDGCPNCLPIVTTRAHCLFQRFDINQIIFVCSLRHFFKHFTNCI